MNEQLSSREHAELSPPRQKFIDIIANNLEGVEAVETSNGVLVEKQFDATGIHTGIFADRVIIRRLEPVPTLRDQNPANQYSIDFSREVDNSANSTIKVFVCEDGQAMMVRNGFRAPLEDDVFIGDVTRTFKTLKEDGFLSVGRAAMSNITKPDAA